MLAASPHEQPRRSAELPVPRWANAADLPITVWIDSAPPLREFRLADRAASALAAWSSAAAIQFRLVDDSAYADLRIVWTNSPATINHDSANAFTRYSVDTGDRIVDAEITVALYRADGRPLTADAVEALLLHEVGHAIGLHHSADVNSVMFPRVAVAELSRADTKAAQRLYARGASEAVVARGS